MVVVDTSVVIDHIRQKGSSDTIFSKSVKKHFTEQFCLSVITVQELYEGKSTATPALEEELLQILASMQILPYNYEVAKLAGQIARDLDRPIDLADAAIAATAIQYQSSLFTLNPADFQNISNLQLLNQ